MAEAALSAIPQPAEVVGPPLDPWTRLGRWLADEKLGSFRAWDCTLRDAPKQTVRLHQMRVVGGADPVDVRCEGPTLEAALSAALEKAGVP
jgi:hypothetical protein